MIAGLPNPLGRVHNVCYYNAAVQVLSQMLDVPWPDDRRELPSMLLPKSNLPSGEQGDAHEILMAMIAHLEFNSQYKTRIERLHGRFARDTLCLTCKHRSRVEEPFLDIPASFGKGRKITTIVDALLDLTEPEALSGTEAYQCSRCVAKSAATRNTYIATFPSFCTVHVLRFKNGRKLSDRFAVSLFWKGDRANSPRYKLVAAIEHLGSFGGGHYVAYRVRKQDEGAWDANTHWSRLDDNVVTNVSENVFLTESMERNVYVLVYEKCRGTGE